MISRKFVNNILAVHILKLCCVCGGVMQMVLQHRNIFNAWSLLWFQLHSIESIWPNKLKAESNDDSESWWEQWHPWESEWTQKSPPCLHKTVIFQMSRWLAAETDNVKQPCKISHNWLLLVLTATARIKTVFKAQITHLYAQHLNFLCWKISVSNPPNYEENAKWTQWKKRYDLVFQNYEDSMKCYCFSQVPFT